MPLRPIDAIFVHPERRLYVVYYRGQLWQLPRMKLDAAAWQRRQPYSGNPDELYLSRQQVIHDAVLAQQLFTLNLPAAISGSSLARFESWWQTKGFSWLSKLFKEGISPLTAHHHPALVSSPAKAIVAPTVSLDNSLLQDNGQNNSTTVQQAIANNKAVAETDIFADMLAELMDQVENERRSSD